ncbi:MAG: T9SS type A sorting domain-containing protein [Bacteroidia bacterium]|jgi:hypothetical protein|nr:T9SS type A sorting domain-containing protein [Bacteroidia bacterium]
MKRTITLLFLALTISFGLKAQVIFSENFTATWTPAAQSWTTINNSSTPGTTTVFQGNGTVFPAFNGGANDYVGMNFNSQDANAAGGISTWLITPSLNISNGTVLEFATRTIAGHPFADRMQVRFSPVDNTTIPSGTTSVGTYTTLLLDINPNLTTLTSSVVSGGVVNGYPDAWAVYTVAVSGLASPVTGRFAFRYFVANGGFAGANSNYIGLDGVKVTNPCTQPVISVAQSAAGVCAGNAVTLTATSTGTNAATTFTWSNNQTGSVAVVSPTNTTTYQVSGTGPGNCVGTQTAVVTVTATPNVSVPSYTVCSSPATTATLTATGASSYSWSTGATTASISVTPTSTTVYTVTGFGAGGNCPSSVTSTVTVGGQLSMIITASSNSVCSGQTVTLTAASAATSYSWSTGALTPVITVTPNSTTTYSVGGISGTFPSVCAGGNSISITVNPSPTLVTSISPSVVCQGQTFTLSALGASTYTWFNSPTTGFTGSVVALTAGAAGPRSYTLIGTGSNGCLAGVLVDFTVNATPTVVVSSPSAACVNNTVTLNAGGAASYVWSGDVTGTGNSISFSSATPGVKTFTATGTSVQGCVASGTASLTVSACTGIESQSIVQSGVVYPNPFTSELKVSDFTGKIEIYNAIGQLVVNQSVNATETINTADLAKGAYIVKLLSTNGDTIKTIKMMKN